MNALGIIAMEIRRSKIIDLYKDYWEEKLQKQAVELGFVLFCSLFLASYKFGPVLFLAFKEETIKA